MQIDGAYLHRRGNVEVIYNVVVVIVLFVRFGFWFERLVDDRNRIALPNFAAVIGGATTVRAGMAALRSTAVMRPRWMAGEAGHQLCDCGVHPHDCNVVDGRTAFCP